MPEVDEIVIVEQSSDLLDAFVERIWHTGKVTATVHQDVYDVMDVLHTDLYLLDIWRGYGECWKDKRFGEWKAKLGDRLWGWGEENR